VAGKKPPAGADFQGMYSTIPIHWNIKSAPASPGRSQVGPDFYVFSFLGIILGSPLSCPDLFLYTITLPAICRDAPPTLPYTSLELASRVLLSSQKPANSVYTVHSDPSRNRVNLPHTVYTHVVAHTPTTTLYAKTLNKDSATQCG
jgi:hypothetical protein